MTVVAFPDRQPDWPIPEADEAERAVLGAVLLRPDALQAAQDWLRSDFFRLPRHRVVWNAIVVVAGAGRAVDFITVKEELTNRGQLEEAGGVAELARLIDGRPKSQNVEHYATLVREAYRLRQIQEQGWLLCKRASVEAATADELIAETERQLREMAGTAGRHGLHAGEDIERVLIDQLQAGLAHTGGVTGLSTGFGEVDYYTSGWQPGELVIIAGRPGSGKTSFAGATLWSAANTGHPTLFASVEMSTGSILRRLACLEARVSYRTARDPRFLSESEMRRYQAAIARLGASALYVDDTPRTVQDIKRLTRLVKARSGRVALVVVDYLQILKAEGRHRGDSRSREVGEMTGEFKALAKEEACPVIVLSQLSRECEKRSKDGRPQLSDLRDSGEIEQDADVVAFVYRPAKYDDSLPDTEGQLIIAKQRNGQVATVPLAWNGEWMRYDSLAKEPG